MKSEGQKQSAKQESRWGRLIAGKTVSGSGSSWSHDADIVSDDLLVEHKWTSKKSFSIQAKIWRKIYNEAWKIGRTPILAIHLSDPPTDVVLMDENDFLELRERALERNNGDSKNND
jgi:hypothetical protein